MPQLDITSFANQIIWLTLIFVTLITIFRTVISTTYNKLAHYKKHLKKNTKINRLIIPKKKYARAFSTNMEKTVETLANSNSGHNVAGVVISKYAMQSNILVRGKVFLASAALAGTVGRCGVVKVYEDAFDRQSAAGRGHWSITNWWNSGEGSGGKNLGSVVENPIKKIEFLLWEFWETITPYLFTIRVILFILIVTYMFIYKKETFKQWGIILKNIPQTYIKGRNNLNIYWKIIGIFLYLWIATIFPPAKLMSAEMLTDYLPFLLIPFWIKIFNWPVGMLLKKEKGVYNHRKKMKNKDKILFTIDIIAIIITLFIIISFLSGYAYFDEIN